MQVGEADGVVEFDQQAQRGAFVFSSRRKSEASATPLGEKVSLGQQPVIIAVLEVAKQDAAQLEAL
ncbi:MAG TPA: hypothetical protein VFE69_01800, partial [Ilumatobacteraceae bacterium]|nr:hypothetical protein [Ilumatobacteraceae bacterium]